MPLPHRKALVPVPRGGRGLLRHPGIDGIAVDTALAVVADKVLDIGVDARLVCAGHSVAADDAGQQAVLGIILIVAAIEGLRCMLVAGAYQPV